MNCLARGHNWDRNMAPVAVARDLKRKGALPGTMAPAWMMNKTQANHKQRMLQQQQLPQPQVRVSRLIESAVEVRRMAWHGVGRGRKKAWVKVICHKTGYSKNGRAKTMDLCKVIFSIASLPLHGGSGTKLGRCEDSYRAFAQAIAASWHWAWHSRGMMSPRS